MSELTWELLDEINGRLEAEMLKSFLEAEGVPAQLIQEGAGQSLYPVNIGALSVVQVFVPKEQLVEAQTLLEEFKKGVEFEALEADEAEAPEDTDENETQEN